MAALETLRPVLALAATATLVAACGATSTPSSTSAQTSTSASSGTTSRVTTSAATPSASAHVGVSERETAALAAELVPLSGLEYRDVTTVELAGHLASLPKSISAASFHSVIDVRSGKEVAFLVLLVPPPSDAMHSQAYALRVAESTLQTTRPTALTESGQQVWYAEDPTTPASRYTYTWLRQGTQAWVDGRDRASIEKFLAVYFASGFRGAESAFLSERLPSLPGYVYTNAVDRARELALVGTTLPGTEATLHYVFDSTHSFGGLVLAGHVNAGTDSVAAASTWLATTYDLPPSGITAGAETTISGVTVHRLSDASSGMSVFVWTWTDTGVTGWLLTSRPDIAVKFLPVYLAAQPHM